MASDRPARTKRTGAGRREREREQKAIEIRIARAQVMYEAGSTIDAIKRAMVAEFRVSRRMASITVRRMFEKYESEAGQRTPGERHAALRRGEALLLRAYEIAAARDDAKGMTAAAERVTQLAIGSAPFGPQKHEVEVSPDGLLARIAKLAGDGRGDDTD